MRFAVNCPITNILGAFLTLFIKLTKRQTTKISIFYYNGLILGYMIRYLIGFEFKTLDFKMIQKKTKHLYALYI